MHLKDCKPVILTHLICHVLNDEKDFCSCWPMHRIISPAVFDQRSKVWWRSSWNEWPILLLKDMVTDFKNVSIPPWQSTCSVRKFPKYHAHRKDIGTFLTIETLQFNNKLEPCILICLYFTNTNNVPIYCWLISIKGNPRGIWRYLPKNKKQSCTV